MLVTALILLVTAAAGCAAQTVSTEPTDERTLFLTVDDSSMLKMPDVTMCVLVLAEDRDLMAKAYPIQPGTTVRFSLGDRVAEYTAYPMGSVYAGKGKWFIKYSKNHGYMDTWKLK